MVEFEFTEEQQSLRRVARDFCADAWPETEVRRLMETPDGFDRAVWARLGRELGLLGLGIPEEYGGAAASLVDLAVVAEEFGRVLASGPWISTIALSATALQRAGDAEVQKRLLPAIAAGETVVALAAADEAGRWGVSGAVTARQVDDGWRLSGAQAYVIDGASADALVVLAVVGSQPSLFVVDGATTGLTREPMATLDQTRRLARLRYDEAPARLVGAVGAGVGPVSEACGVAAVLLAAEAVGAADHLVGTSVEYARTRLQFGRPIGSFQAVKHRCVDMHVEVELARSTAYHAAWSLDDGIGHDRLAVDLATVVTANTFLRVAKDSVQVHGGIGFTWEHPAHLYYKRAVSNAALLGGRAAATERLAGSAFAPAG